MIYKIFVIDVRMLFNQWIINLMKLLVFFLLIALDLISKQLIAKYVKFESFISIFPFFYLTNIHNYGISFGLFDGVLSSWVIVFIGFLLTLVIFYLYIKTNNNTEKWAF